VRVAPSSELLNVDGNEVKVVGTSNISEFVCVEREIDEIVVSDDGA
jgi:hypothetical protein